MCPCGGRSGKPPCSTSHFAIVRNRTTSSRHFFGFIFRRARGSLPRRANGVNVAEGCVRGGGVVWGGVVCVGVGGGWGGGGWQMGVGVADRSPLKSQSRDMVGNVC
jgi:hypothetical protein